MAALEKNGSKGEKNTDIEKEKESGDADIKKEPADAADEKGEAAKGLVREDTFEFEVREADDSVRKEELEEREEGEDDDDADAQSDKTADVSPENSGTPSPVPSDAVPGEDDDEEERKETAVAAAAADETENDWRAAEFDPERELKPGQFIGHVSQQEKFFSR